MKNRIVYAIVAVAFVGGLFSAAYAGPIINTITLAGNVLITGDTELDGKLIDTNNEAGTSGQVLSSLGTGIDWIDATGSDTLGNLSCSTDQIARWTDSAWECSKISSNTPPAITIVDSTENVGQFTSIAVGDDGFPVISYQDITNGALKVAKCANAACTVTSAITTVDPGKSPGSTSIAVGDDGFPVISYYAPSTGTLWVAKCVNVACSGTSTITEVDASGGSGLFSSIAVGDDGFPVISYWDGDFLNANLKVAKCVNVACTGTSTITVVDPRFNVGLSTSIAIGDDGFPVISYFDSASNVLAVAKCVNAACTGTSTITTVDSSGVVGGHSSIAVGDDGFPVISYFDNTNDDLKVAKCVNVACTGISTITSVDTTERAGTFTSIAIGSGGFPVISYLDITNQDLKMAKCVNVACTGASIIITADSKQVGVLGQDTSIAIGTDGFPVISYFDLTTKDLKVFKELGIIFN